MQRIWRCIPVLIFFGSFCGHWIAGTDKQSRCRQILHHQYPHARQSRAALGRFAARPAIAFDNIFRSLMIPFSRCIHPIYRNTWRQWPYHGKLSVIALGVNFHRLANAANIDSAQQSLCFFPGMHPQLSLDMAAITRNAAKDRRIKTATNSVRVKAPDFRQWILIGCLKKMTMQCGPIRRQWSEKQGAINALAAPGRNREFN